MSKTNDELEREIKELRARLKEVFSKVVEKIDRDHKIIKNLQSETLRLLKKIEKMESSDAK